MKANATAQLSNELASMLKRPTKKSNGRRKEGAATAGWRLRGAARDAAGGAAIGVIAGDAGARAIAGTVRGGMAQRAANHQSKQHAAAQVVAAQKKAEELLLLQHQ